MPKFFTERNILIVLTILYILPIWIVSYVPTQDGPSHLANTFILKEYYNTEYPIFQQYYDLNLKPIPNLLSSVVLSFLMCFFPPLIAEKLLLTLYIISFSLSLSYLLRTIGQRKIFFSIEAIGFLFIYNELFYRGFYNFVCGIPLYFIAIGYWWKNKDALQIKKCIVLNLILIFAYFCHIVSVTLAIFTIIILLLFTITANTYKKRAYTILYLIPSYLLPLWFIEDICSSLGNRLEFNMLFSYITSMSMLVSLNAFQIWIAKLLSWLFIILFLYTLVKKTKFIRFNESQSLLINFNAVDSFLLLFILFLCAYFFAPHSVGIGQFVNTRLSLYVFLILLPWFTQVYREAPKKLLEKVFRKAIAIFVIVLVLLNLSIITISHIKLNKHIVEFTKGLGYIKANRTLLPLIFNHYKDSYRIPIFNHAADYYVLATGSVNLDNYEPTAGTFPLIYKPNLNIPDLGTVEYQPQKVDIARYVSVVDYILTWELDNESRIAKEIKKHYRIVFESGDVKLFIRKDLN